MYTNLITSSVESILSTPTKSDISNHFYHVSHFVEPSASRIKPRSGCKDVWNAFMAQGATFSQNDIPCCPTTATSPPDSIITWEEAVELYKLHRKRKKLKFFKSSSFVCFYVDDYKFDGPGGIWQDPKNALKILKHFSGIISPDYSTYQDFPDPLKRIATYKMRLFGFWISNKGIPVINNLRWGTKESFDYCLDGLPKNSMLAIGTVGGSPKRLRDRKRFIEGLYNAIEILTPHTIIVYGSANYHCFEELKKLGIKIIPYTSRTASVFERRKEAML